MAKLGFSRQKSKFTLFSNEVLLFQTFQMTSYLFVYDVSNRSCERLEFSTEGNYIWRKTQSKFRLIIRRLTWNR